MTKIDTQKTFLNEINQLKEKISALNGLAYLINPEFERDNFIFVQEALNKLKNVNIELSDCLIFWSNAKRKGEI